jgi:RNA polymerase sigma factor (TIGR02999 family)
MGLSSPSITQLLQAWRNGDAAALEQLTPLVYSELRRVAGAYVARHASPLQATEVVNEVFRRLIERDQITWPDRAHFFAFCAKVIRNILVDHFRRQRHRASLSEAKQLSPTQDVDVLKLHEALNELAEFDPRASRVVELRFFGGLTEKEIAEELQIAVPTVKRDWRKARAWLAHELRREETR